MNPLFQRRRKILVALLTFVVILAVLLYSQLSPIGELLPKTIAALESDDAVLVNRARWIVFQPSVKTESGFIFYPGGRVMPEAYSPLARALAEAGHLSVIIPMPLNLAVLNPNAASDVIAAFPSIQRWVLGGHSLGGVMAARFAHAHEDKIDGLALLASYPERHVDLSESELAVATIYGDQDGLVTVAEVQRSLDLLPLDSLAILVEGGNHAQFGWYGGQSGDKPAQVSREEQQAQVVAAVLHIMQEAGR